MVRPELANIPVLNVLPDIPQMYTSSQGFSFILDAIILATLFAALFAPLGRMMFKGKENETMGQRFGAVLGIIFGVSGAFALAGAGLTLFGFWVTALLAAIFFSFALYKIMLNIFGEKAKILAGVIAFIIAWVLMDAYLVTTDLEIVRNVFGFLSLLAPVIFLVSVIYLIQQKWKKGETEEAAAPAAPPAGPRGPGIFRRMFSWMKPKPKSPEQIGGDINIESQRATDSIEALKGILEAANKAKTSSEASQAVSAARQYVTQANNAASKAESLLSKLPPENKAAFAQASAVARAAAIESQQILGKIETITAQIYLKEIYVTLQNTQHLASLAIDGATRATAPNVAIDAVSVLVTQARTHSDNCTVSASQIKRLFTEMKNNCPKNKAEVGTAKTYNNKAKDLASEAETAVKRAEKKLKAMQKEAAPTKLREKWWQVFRPKAGEIKIIGEVKKGEEETKKDAKGAEKKEKELTEVADGQEKISKGLTDIDNDAARTVSAGASLKGKKLTKQQILQFYTIANESITKVERMFVEIRNLTKSHADKLEKSYQETFDKISNNVGTINSEFERAKEILNKELRPAVKTQEAQRVLALVDTAVVNMAAALEPLKSAVERLRSVIAQYERMRTECLISLQKIMKREELVKRYAVIARISIKNLGEKAEKENVTRNEIAEPIDKITGAYDKLHHEISKVYVPTHKFVGDYINSYKKVIESISADLTECAKLLKQLGIPAKSLQDGMQTLVRIINQPPGTAGAPAPIPAPPELGPARKGRPGRR